MSRRSAEWNEGLARNLRRRSFAQEFIRGCIDEGLSLQETMAKVVRAYGVSEFAEKTGLPSSNILRAINPRHNPTLETLHALLRPFGLELSVAPQRRKRGTR
jgi:DNA-binding phage protein